MIHPVFKICITLIISKKKTNKYKLFWIWRPDVHSNIDLLEINAYLFTISSVVLLINLLYLISFIYLPFLFI